MKMNKVAILFAVIAILFAGVGCYKFAASRNSGKQYEELQEEVKTEEPEETQEAEEEPEEEGVEIPIDFAALQEENPEVYAWITVPGTNVDYPILQHDGDNSYYLNHDIDGKEDIAGAIFTEDYNSKDFTDPNTVIYGHNMKNGSMFRTLHNYSDRSFFDENRDVTIYMPDKILHYEIFAAYLYDSRHLLLSFDFQDQQVFAQYLSDVRARRDMNSFVDTSIEVTSEDRIITLSTCYAGMADRRYLVQAVLVSIEE